MYICIERETWSRSGRMLIPRKPSEGPTGVHYTTPFNLENKLIFEESKKNKLGL